jgi:hypothetical protein
MNRRLRFAPPKQTLAQRSGSAMRPIVAPAGEFGPAGKPEASGSPSRLVQAPAAAFGEHDFVQELDAGVDRLDEGAGVSVSFANSRIEPTSASVSSDRLSLAPIRHENLPVNCVGCSLSAQGCARRTASRQLLRAGGRRP